MGNFSSSYLNEFLHLSFLQDYQLYADIARAIPVMKFDHSVNDDDDNDDNPNSTWKTTGHCVPIDLKEYL